MANKKHDAEVEQIINGLAGDIRIGQKYYIFTVTYHFIGTVESVNSDVIRLAPDALLVMNAGSSNDPITRIVNNKVEPQTAECPGKPILIKQQSVVTLIPF